MYDTEYHSDSYSDINLSDLGRKLPFMQKLVRNEEQKKDVEQFIKEMVRIVAQRKKTGIYKTISIW